MALQFIASWVLW